MEAGGAGEREPGKYPALADPQRSWKSWRTWVLVVGVFVVPTLLYLTTPAVPLLPIGTGQKLWVSAGLVVVAETIFLLSVFVLGREVVRRYLDPRRWFGEGRY